MPVERRLAGPVLRVGDRHAEGSRWNRRVTAPACLPSPYTNPTSAIPTQAAPSTVARRFRRSSRSSSDTSAMPPAGRRAGILCACLPDQGAEGQGPALDGT